MEANIGKSLREARLQRNLSIEDVAKATKIPKARIVDLENDDYSKFPSLAYARGFLAIYARFLNVDRSKYAPLDVGSHLSLLDYQYLKDEAVTSLSFGPRRKEPPKRLVWLKRIGFLMIAALVGMLSAWAVLEWNRLPSIDQLINREAQPEEGNPTAAAEPTPAPAPAPTPEPTPEPIPEPSPAVAPVLPPTEEPVIVTEGELMEQELMERTGEPAMAQPEPTPTAPPPSTPVNSSSEILGPVPEETPIPAATPAVSPTATPELPVREIKVTAKRRTRVKITDEDGTAVFDDWLRRGASVLVKGRYFQIESPDTNALKVTSDGKTVAPGANNRLESGVEIQ